MTSSAVPDVPGSPDVPGTADVPGSQDALDRKGKQWKHEYTIAVVGAGYVGLTAAVCFAHLGHHVICTDADAARILRLQQGENPIHEPGIDELLRVGLASKRLEFHHGSVAAAAAADFVYLCVPTPQGEDGAADLSYLEAAATEIGPHLRVGAIVVNKSTVPTGSVALVRQILGRSDVGVASNPEFLREGSAVSDFLHPDRVVIGSEERAVAERVAELYAGLQAPVLITDSASAETIKYAANAFLATKLSFTNAIAAVCEAVGADVVDVLSGIGHDRRIGRDFMRPGPGWGGSCLPKDTRGLLAMSNSAGYDFELLRCVLAANDQQFQRIVDKVAARVDLPGARVALLGLAFKAGTDDVRASPAIQIAKRLTAAGALVRACDPAVSAAAVANEAGLSVVGDAYEACSGAKAVVVATEWEEFALLDFARVGSVMSQRHVVDARNLLNRAALEHLGFTYSAVGVP